MLGSWAPIALILFISIWISGLIFGWGCIFYGLRHELRPVPDFGEAIYFAGTSLLTIGFGDVVAVRGPARACAILAAGTGFGTGAVLTTFLFSLFGAFQRREIFVVSLGQRAGAPPSGVELLQTYARLDLMADIGDLFKAGQVWCAEVMESHLAYPVLTYFRSTHDYESWVGAIGALLDASTLVLTTVEGFHEGEARLMLGLGRHLTHDFCDYFGFEFTPDVGVERSEFDRACARLADAGLTVRDPEEAWPQFARVRSSYSAQLNAMARYWRIPPAQWVGDRSVIRQSRHNVNAAPNLANEIDDPERAFAQ